MGRTKHPGVRAASETSIEITFTYRGQRCRERIKRKPSPANLKVAYNHRCAILSAIENDTFDYAYTFPNSEKSKQFITAPGAHTNTKKFLDAWLKSATLKASTAVTYRRIINNQLIPQFGHLMLTDIKWRDVRDWLKPRDISQKTTNNILTVFRSALDTAVEDELVGTNPLFGKKLKRERKIKIDEIDPFSVAERQAIFTAATGQELNLIQFAFWTGLRPSELCALDWNDVDWIRNTVRINKATTQAAKGEAEAPKTDAGNREVKLLPPALEALQAQKSHTFFKDQEIFQNPRTSERWTSEVVIRARMWKRVLRKAKVRYRYPYQMRHTYASTLLQAGENVMWVSQQMGHTDWTFTAKTYSRFIPDDAPDAGEKAMKMWQENAGKKLAK